MINKFNITHARFYKFKEKINKFDIMLNEFEQMPAMSNRFKYNVKQI